MSYEINGECISCGACAGECPVGAIYEGETQFEIDVDLCVDCGCCANVCPTDAPNPIK